MAEARHGKQTIAEGLHSAIAYEYVDGYYRLSDGPFEVADRNKLARQLDDNSIWLLADPLTPTWLRISEGSSPSGDIDILVRKSTSGTIASGKYVYITGYDVLNSILLVEEALSNSIATMPAIGVSIEPITDFVDASVRTYGVVDNLIDTSSFTLGDTLFVSSSASGDITITEPTGTNIVQEVGSVEFVDNPGVIFVNIKDPRWVAQNAPSEITDSTNSLGTINKSAKENHTHAHGNRGGGTLHSNATISVSGFMSSTDKSTLDSLSAGNVTVPVRNETGVTLLRGRAVYVVDWDSPSQIVLVDYADKDDASKRPAIAVLNSDIPNNSNGTGTLQGVITNVDTSLFTSTDQLVLGNNGVLIRPPPDNATFTGEVQNLGFVGRVHPSQGTIVVAIDGLDTVTSSQVFALAGTNGTPSGTNKYVTDSDSRMSNDRTASGLRTTTGVVSISGALAPILGQTLVATSGTNATWQTVTFGDVYGPASSTDNAVARFDLTTGKLIQDSVVLIGDTGIITGVSTINGVTIETHASRHNPGGADALALGTPVSIGTANSAGVATSFVRSDHVHEHGNQTVGTLHATVSNTANGFVTVVGVVGTVLQSTGTGADWVTELTNPQKVAIRKNTGTNIGARPRLNFIEGSNVTLTITDDSVDNEVDITINAASGISLATTTPSSVNSGTGTVGIGTTAARSDHTHQVSTSTPTGLVVGGSNVIGTGPNLSMADHIHALPAFGSTSGTFCQGSDSRLSDDRTASGLRTLTTIVSVSGATAPVAGQVLKATSSTTATWQNDTIGTGDVVGPGTATDNAVARFDLTTGKLIQDSVVLIGDTGIITGVSTINGVTIETHASRHNPGGADALALGTPSSIGNANSAGTATSFVRSDHIHALAGTVGGDLNGTLPNPTVRDLTITNEVQGSLLYFNGTNWVQLSPGISGEALKTQGAGANPVWGTVSGLTAPENPAEDGYVAIADGGDLIYIGGVNDGDVLTWNDSLNTWEPQIINSKKLVIVEFTLTDDINNTTQWFTTWRGSGGDTSSQKLSGSNSGLQNQNACSPFQVPFDSTIIKAVLTLKGAGVQNGSVTYPVSYQVDLFSEGFTSETKIGDIDFSISNLYTVGTYSVGNTNFKGSVILSIDVNEGDMLALKFMNGSGASIVGQTRNAFITLLLEER